MFSPTERWQTSAIHLSFACHRLFCALDHSCNSGERTYLFVPKQELFRSKYLTRRHFHRRDNSTLRGTIHDDYRCGLLTSISSLANGANIDGFTYIYDALNRPIIQEGEMLNKAKCNCQDYADMLLSKYRQLIKNQKVKCKCGLK